MLKVKIDSDNYGTAQIEENGNSISFIVERIKNRLEIISFCYGYITTSNNKITRYEGDALFKKSYSKSGKGRESIEAKEMIKILYGNCKNEIEDYTFN